MNLYFKTFCSVFLSSVIIAQTPATKYVRPDYLNKKQDADPVSVLKKAEENKSMVIKATEQVDSNTNAEIVVENPTGYLQVKSQIDLFNRAKVYEVVSNEQGKKKYVFTGPNGKYLVTVTSFSQERGLTEDTIVVKIGKDDPVPPPVPQPINVDPIPVPDPVIPISDKWGIGLIIKEELEKISGADIEQNIKKIGQVYLDIAKEYQSGQISSGNDAYSKLQARITASVNLSTRQSISKLNVRLNDKLKVVWADLVKDRMAMVSWFTVIGNGHLNFSPANIVVKPQSINVLMLYESADIGRPENRKIATTIYSTNIRSYLTSKGYEWKVWDKDVFLDNVDEKWKKMEDLADDSPIPSISIFDQNGKLLESTKIIDEQTTLNLIKKWVE